MLNSITQFLLGIVFALLLAATHSYITEGSGIHPLLSIFVAIAITIAAICSNHVRH